uniref:Uncharacterized protein n=1 Tax=Molossus molossus TaxID=27622 RepID=A0A7J8FS76_MOLMO|nr:hypothetical protein HJG59_008370 [Molossus molossus]
MKHPVWRKPRSDSTGHLELWAGSLKTLPHICWNITPLGGEPQLPHLHIQAPVKGGETKVGVPVGLFVMPSKSLLSFIHLQPLAGKKLFSKCKDIKAYYYQLACDALRTHQSQNSALWSAI